MKKILISCITGISIGYAGPIIITKDVDPVITITNEVKKEESNVVEEAVGDFKPQTGLREINQSDYQQDHKIYYDLFEQHEKLQAFIDHPKISEEAKRAVRNTLIQLEHFLDYAQAKGGKFVIVNIPSYTLVAFDENILPVLESKVVVGAKNKKTPLKTISITHLKYNPTWTPTPNMIKHHIMTKNGINLKYLREHGLKAYQNGVEVPYDEIEERQNYRFSQPFGVDNALGVLKFETNSQDNIYLHDTNQPYLFKNKYRAYSSGCIRVQNYLDLASWLVTDDIENKHTIEKNIHKEKTYYQKVNRMPVYFTYFQAFVNKNNKLVNFPNVYNLSDSQIRHMFTE